MSVSEYITCLTVVSAAELPKTDRMSKIDPYVIVRLGNQQHKTRAIDDNDYPQWNARFFLRVQKNPSGFLTGALQFDLYDEDSFSDSHVATTVLSLDMFTPDKLGHPQTLKLAYVKDKYQSQGKAPTITVKLEGMLQSYDSLRSMLGAMPGLVLDDPQRRAYIPVQDSGGLLYVGVEYEADSVDIKVYVTRPSAPLFLDLVVLAGRQHTKIRRRLYRQGERLANGQLTVFEELKLDDVPLSFDFNQLALMVFDSRPLSSTNADLVVTQHGWRGALGFHQACQVLKDVQIDHKEQEIYMTVDAGETMLLVDYDKDDADIKLAVLASPATAEKGYDLTIRGKSFKKTSEIFTPPKGKLGNSVQLVRIYELDDLPYGTRFDDIEINRYHLSNARQYTIQNITRLMG